MKKPITILAFSTLVSAALAQGVLTNYTHNGTGVAATYATDYVYTQNSSYYTGTSWSLQPNTPRADRQSAVIPLGGTMTPQVSLGAFNTIEYGARASAQTAFSNAASLAYYRASFMSETELMPSQIVDGGVSVGSIFNDNFTFTVDKNVNVALSVSGSLPIEYQLLDTATGRYDYGVGSRTGRWTLGPGTYELSSHAIGSAGYNDSTSGTWNTGNRAMSTDVVLQIAPQS